MPNNKDKGTKFETDISKELSLWWTGGETDDVFWHTHGSGARATSRAKKGRDTYGQQGDICFVNPIGRPLLEVFTFELKKGYPAMSASNVLEALDSFNVQPLMEFIHKIEREARAAGSLTWAVIGRRDNKKKIITLPMDTWLNEYLNTTVPQFYRGTDHLILNTRRKPPYVGKILQIKLEDFFRLVKPRRLCDLVIPF